MADITPRNQILRQPQQLTPQTPACTTTGQPIPSTSSIPRSLPALTPQPASNMPPLRRPPPPHLLICALGNPGAAYATTLHSAAHVFILALARQLQTSSPLTRDRAMAGLVSQYCSTDPNGDERDWVLWQSTSYMNESGPGVRSAWLEFLKRKRVAGAAGSGDAGPPVPRLVVLHDEMREDAKPFGTLSVRLDGQRVSARGHNGIKSVVQSLQGAGSTLGAGWVKVGINIGRPPGREPGLVSDFVLGKMSPAQIQAIERAAERFEDEVVGLIDESGSAPSKTNGKSRNKAKG